jgi:hypothetical protein
MADEQARKPKLVVGSEIDEAAIQVPKPDEFSLDKFKSTQEVSIANVETLLTALPHHPISQAKDFVRLHEAESTHWSPELCFVNVPIKGQKHDTLHLIDEAIAVRYLESARIQRFRLALATKPYDIFFLCHVPTRNLDNDWNKTNLDGCVRAKDLWVHVTSRKEEGVEAYKITPCRDRDAFSPPKWPKQSLDEIIYRTFTGRMINTEDHPGLLRLIGAKQSVS